MRDDYGSRVSRGSSGDEGAVDDDIAGAASSRQGCREGSLSLARARERSRPPGPRRRRATGTATTINAAAAAARARGAKASVPSDGSVRAEGMAQKHFRRVRILRREDTTTSISARARTKRSHRAGVLILFSPPRWHPESRGLGLSMSLRSHLSDHRSITLDTFSVARLRSCKASVQLAMVLSTSRKAYLNPTRLCFGTQDRLRQEVGGMRFLDLRTPVYSQHGSSLVLNFKF